MTATKTQYAVYVRDAHGWDDCPDYKGVFFGTIPAGGTYVHPRESEFGGHVEFACLSEAEAFAELLDESGDWRVNAPNQADYGKETRPEYAVAPVEIE